MIVYQLMDGTKSHIYVYLSNPYFKHKIIGVNGMLKVNRDDKSSIWQQLLDQAIHNITTGKWPPGELLPPSRELALLVGVSRSTIQIVYEELFSRGYTVTNRRGGTRVSEWGYKNRTSEEMRSRGKSTPELPLLNAEVDQLQIWLRGKENQNIEKIGNNHFYRLQLKQT